MFVRCNECAGAGCSRCAGAGVLAGVQDLDEAIRQKAIETLRRKDPAAWTVQGLGMMRAYLDVKREYRLHVWDRRIAYKPEPSRLHTHPWDFTSWVLAGRLAQQRFVETPQGALYLEQQIRCGVGACVLSPPKPVWLAAKSVEIYEVGQGYVMTRDEIHDSFPRDGTVTIIRRTFHEDTETARVFYSTPQWISAEPKEAPPDLVARILNSISLADEVH